MKRTRLSIENEIANIERETIEIEMSADKSGLDEYQRTVLRRLNQRVRILQKELENLDAKEKEQPM